MDTGLEGGKLNSPKPQGCKLNNVDELISNFKWNRTLILRTFGPNEAGKILKIPISLARKPNSYFWSHSNKGQFTIRSTYEAMTREKRRGKKSQQ